MQVTDIIAKLRTSASRQQLPDRSHNSITCSNNNPRMPQTTKHQKKQNKPLQLQHVNSQD
jgi:hypothetical protein